MEEDLVTLICRDLNYSPRREREMRLMQMLYEGGWRTGTEQRIAWVRGLSDMQLNGISTSIVIGRANDKIEKALDTIYEKTGLDIFPGHAIDGRDLNEGVMHRLEDSKGRPAFEGVFNSEFWSRPQGSDLTIKDVNLILPEELREPNFGVPTKKAPGVV